jgi:Flp pilus assembly protein TadG
MAKRISRGLLGDKSGAAAVVMALTLPVVLGGLGLGTEVSYWYFNQRKVQSSADMAAYAGAVELRSGNSVERVEAAATAAAEETGYAADIGTITLNSPPSAGAFAGDANAVEVTVEEDMPRWFSGIFADGTVNVAGRAVARIAGGQQTCVLALDKSAAGAVAFDGNTSATLVGCNVHSNSLSDNSVLVKGSAGVETPCVSASGKVTVSADLTLTECVAPYEHADQTPDPYDDVPVPPIPAAATSNNLKGKGPFKHDPGKYAGLTLHDAVNLAAGVYVIDGGSLKINAGASVTGSGVTFYLTNGATIDINGSANIAIDAPESGSYAGLLFFVGRDQTTEQKINGNSFSTVNGAIYAAGANIEMLGNGTSGGGCTQIVSRTVKFSGNFGLDIDCTGSGVRDIRTSRLVTLVE